MSNQPTHTHTRNPVSEMASAAKYIDVDILFSLEKIKTMKEQMFPTKPDMTMNGIRYVFEYFTINQSGLFIVNAVNVSYSVKLVIVWLLLYLMVVFMIFIFCVSN